MTVAQWYSRVSRWVVKSLLPVAPEGQTLTETFLRKADEELAEFKAELRKRPLDCAAVAEEAVDACITIFAAAGSVVTSDELVMAIHRKMAVLEAGDWYYDPQLKVFKRRK